ncbi:MAG: EndoU domain-containing protein [Burkholderiales bacterium]|nr:EndoU domain-containing protein [Burkholderiales bacterium]
MLKAIDPTGAALSPGQQAAMEGFATLLGGGLAGLAGANAQGGATAAQNEVLNNTDDHPETAAKNGGVLSQFGSFLGDQLASAGRGAVNMGNQFIGLMNANSGQTPPSDSNPLVQANDGNPPNTGASPVTPSTPATPVCDPPVCTVMPGSPGTSGHITISSGNSGDDSGSASTANDGGNTGSDNNSLLDPKGENHVLYGDGPTSGGHLAGVGKPGKSEFPVTWGAQDITNAISDIATDPKTQWSPPDPRNGYVTGTGTINGVDIKVIYDPNKGRIVTGYPTNLPRNPK